MRIVFAGTPAFAAVALQGMLAAGHHIVAVYCQPDRQAGRGMRVQTGPVKQIALQHRIEVQQPLHFKDEQTLARLRSYTADVMIVAAYGIILPATVLSLFKLGCFNIHASLLPRWRGAAPIIRAIEAGDDETGITMMRMDPGLDTGPIVSMHRLSIAHDVTGGRLHDQLAELGRHACLAMLIQIATGKLVETPQDHRLATYAHKINKQEALLDWSQAAALLERKIRAFNPWPVCFSFWQQQRIRLLQAQEVPLSPAQALSAPGEIISVSKSGIDVATGDGALRLLVLQQPGGKAQPVAQLIQHWPIAAGQFFHAHIT